MTRQAGERERIVDQVLTAIAAAMTWTITDIKIEDIPVDVESDRIMFHVPIGRGVHEPVLLDLPGVAKDRTLVNVAGAVVAKQVRAIRQARQTTMRRLRRLRRLAEILAVDARNRGASVEVVEVALDAVACALCVSGAATTLRLLVLGDDLHRVTYEFTTGDANDVRSAFKETIADQMVRAARLAEARRHGAIGRIDPVALAALAGHSLSRSWLGRWALPRGHARRPGAAPTGLHLEWRNGTVVVETQLASSPRVTWRRDRLELHQSSLPEAVRIACIGRLVTDVLDHHFLKNLAIAEVDEYEDDGFTCIVPVPPHPLLLRADGSTRPLP